MYIVRACAHTKNIFIYYYIFIYLEKKIDYAKMILVNKMSHYVQCVKTL